MSPSDQQPRPRRGPAPASAVEGRSADAGPSQSAPPASDHAPSESLELPPPEQDGLTDDAERVRIFESLFTTPAEPQRRGRYIVRGTLGRGGMGTVVEAYDEALDRPVALKLLHPNITQTHAARLEREAQALAQLSHPNVVQVYELGMMEERAFISMELVKGQTLHAWVHQQPRSWAECVEVYLQAGRGLAAAHARSLVHRDFKPANCILDEQGRVRVLDFGLAREVSLPSNLDQSSQDERSSLNTTLEASLTRTGAVVGTLAYMPLEQLSGQIVDARADQFSFCVSLYEAVYGERPFAGDTRYELFRALRVGKVRPAPAPAPNQIPVPAKLRRVLLKGLSRQPSQRWPSMDALLGALRRVSDPWRGRRRILLAGGLATLGLGAALWSSTLAGPCQGSERRLVGVWDEPTRARVQAAFEQTGVAYAHDTWQQIDLMLSGYAARWVQAHTEACATTRLEQTQPESVMDARMRCLDDRLRHLGALVDTLTAADVPLVRSSVRVINNLPTLEACADERYAQTHNLLPDDPATREQVIELRTALAQVAVLGAMGETQEELASMRELEERIEAIGYEPLRAEALLLTGRLQSDNGRYALAVESLSTAFYDAVSQGLDEIAANAAIHLVFIVGVLQGRHRIALDEWAKHAHAAVERVGDDQMQAKLLSHIGNTHDVSGNYEQALHYFQRAMSIMEDSGSNQLAMATTLENLGFVYSARSEHEIALDHHQRARAIYEQTLGPLHPDTARSINNIGTVYAMQEDYDRALPYFQQCLSIQEQALDPLHPEIAGSLRNIGEVYSVQGQLDLALEHFLRALSIRELTLRPLHPEIANSLDDIGDVHLSRHEYDKALEYHLRALSIKEQSLDPSHPSIASTLGDVGRTYRRRHEYDKALEYYLRALSIKERALGSTHLDVATAHRRIGNLYEDLEQYEPALQHQQRALSIRERALGPDNISISRSLKIIGDIHRKQGSFVQATATYRRALKIVEKARGPRHWRAGELRLELAIALLTEDETTAAIEQLESAVSILEDQPEPELRGEARFTLARALAANHRSLARARELALAAREDYLQRNGDDSETIAKIDAFVSRLAD